MYKYYNANPWGLHINDCTVRAYALAEKISWDQAYRELSCFAQAERIMPDDVKYIDNFLLKRYPRVYNHEIEKKISVEKFIEKHNYGTFLITMRGHITCCVNGCIYDTFDPSDRIIWDVYKVK